MNKRLIAFSLTTAVGICFATSRLTADELSTEACVFCGDAGCAEEVIEVQPTELTDELAVTEECQFCKEAGCFDTVIDETVASEGEPEDHSGEVDASVCIDETCESERIAVAEGAGTSDFEAVEDAADDDAQTSEEAVVEADTGTEQESLGVVLDEDVVDEFECVEGFEGWIVEREVEAEELTQQDTPVAETTEILEDEASVETVEPAGEEASINDTAGDIEVAESSDVDVTEDLVAEDAVPEPESISDKADIVSEVIEHSDSVEVDSNTEVAETAIADDVATEVATESDLPDHIVADEYIGEVDGTGSETDQGDTTQELIEELIQLIDEEAVPEADEIADRHDAVAENDGSVEIAQPLAEEAALPESESPVIHEVEESESGTVRTIELGDCKVIIESERQIDDFELLETLWQAVNQLEVEMD
ncbi:MAG: hypothetical protein CMJ64_11555 [Planctomycetaceae bacterium]|nr:hypothetical protein [Planctomycetaceae bacterium]